MILTLIQARMSSSRLPGKVMAPILGRPMLERQIERVGRARRIGRLAVATSNQTSDDPIAALCADLALPCFRGDLADVLGRFTAALVTLGPAQHVVRLTGDCPLADPDVIDHVVDLHLTSGADYSNNTGRLTFPKGLDVEVVRAPLLAIAASETNDPYDREHVTPFFYRRPDRFRLAHLERDPPLGDLRWTVDTPEDLTFVTRVYERLYPIDPRFSSDDVLVLTRDDPPRSREG